MHDTPDAPDTLDLPQASPDAAPETADAQDDEEELMVSFPVTVQTLAVDDVSDSTTESTSDGTPTRETDTDGERTSGGTLILGS